MRNSQTSDKPGRANGHTAPATVGKQESGGASDSHASLHSAFRWQVPAEFNIADVCCARWATLPDATKRIAIRQDSIGTGDPFYTYSQLHEQACRLANALVAWGVQRGDRVAIVLPQRFETAVAYMAVLQMGAVATPLSMLFGPEALHFRLHDSEAVVALCDESTVANLLAVRGDCPNLRRVIGIGQAGALADAAYGEALATQPAQFTCVSTLAEEPAVLIYTSGTTGNPKGALIPHRALIGNLTGFVCSQNWFGFDPFPARAVSCVDGAALASVRQHSTFWSPADWAWTGGLIDALLPTLYFGQTIVAYNGRFSPEAAFSTLQRFGVTHTFLFPTALKAMMKAFPGQAGDADVAGGKSPQKKGMVHRQFNLQLQAIMSAGEAVGDAVFAYCRDQLGVTVNEMFGQTEINYIVGNCAPTLPAPGRPGGGDAPFGWPARPGSMGKAYPGHRVAVIDDEGRECPVGVPGDVALNRFDVHGHPDPILFLGYWKNDAATGAKFTGDWCRTGDLAVCDADGYLWYQGRSDDVFKAAGYRIGPGEIENCLVKHPAVLNAAVVPKPDAERGAVVKAYVVLAPDVVARRRTSIGTGAAFDQVLVEQLQSHVKGLLAPYEYPKEIEFVDALPMTTTGKVQRRVLRLQEEARFAAKSPASN